MSDYNEKLTTYNARICKLIDRIDEVHASDDTWERKYARLRVICGEFGEVLGLVGEAAVELLDN